MYNNRHTFVILFFPKLNKIQYIIIIFFNIVSGIVQTYVIYI